jgi:hypothetical protein
MKTLGMVVTTLIVAAGLPGLAHGQGKSLTCVIDQLTPAQRESIGSALLSGDASAGANPAVEGATANCSTKFKPEEVKAAGQYALDSVVYEASSAQLKAMGAPGVVDAVWAKVDPAKRKAVAEALKEGSPPDDLVAGLQSQLPKGDDALAASVTALAGLQAKASMAMAEVTAGQ